MCDSSTDLATTYHCVLLDSHCTESLTVCTQCQYKMPNSTIQQVCTTRQRTAAAVAHYRRLHQKLKNVPVHNSIMMPMSSRSKRCTVYSFCQPKSSQQHC